MTTRSLGTLGSVCTSFEKRERWGGGVMEQSDAQVLAGTLNP